MDSWTIFNIESLRLVMFFRYTPYPKGKPPMQVLIQGCLESTSPPQIVEYFPPRCAPGRGSLCRSTHQQHISNTLATHQQHISNTLATHQQHISNTLATHQQHISNTLATHQQHTWAWKPLSLDSSSNGVDPQRESAREKELYQEFSVTGGLQTVKNQCPSTFTIPKPKTLNPET